MKPELQHFFSSMKAFLQEEGGVPALRAARPGWEAPPSRVALYRHFVRGHVRSALEKLYPHCRRALGPQPFAALVRGFRVTSPARSFETNALGRGFPGYLAGQQLPAGLPPWLPPLARFEWADFEVFASEQPQAPAPSPGWLTPNPTLTLLEHPFRICAFVRAGGGQKVPEPGAELALLWRHPERLVTRYLAADDRALLVLKLAVEGIPLEEAASAGGSPVEALRRLVEGFVEAGLVSLTAP